MFLLNKNMRKLVVAITLSFVFAALLVMGAQAATTRTLTVYDADAGLYIDSQSKFCYTVDNETMTATVTGHPDGIASEDGSENDFQYGSTTNTALVPTSVNVNSMTYTVTAVADDGFANHTSLIGIGFESDVKIGERAFIGCSSLANLTLGGVTYIGDGAFSYCALKTITIPESVTYIGNNAFYYNASLASIDGMESNNITAIGSGAFQGTDWYKKLTDEFVILGNGILVKYNGTSEAVVIPENVVGISNAFAGNTTVTSIDFSKATELEFIGNNAFYGCKNITALEIPDTVKHIGDFAFSDCYALEDVSVGSGLETIGFCAFSGCDALQSFECTSVGLTSLGQCAFWNCAALKSVKLASCPDVLSLGYLWGAGIEEYDIPDNIKTIDKAAFAGIKNLVVVIPKSVENIVADAFAGSSVTVICTPDSVAAQYAELNFGSDNTKKVVFFGDVNADGAVDIKDATHLIKNLAGNKDATLDNKYAADTAFDGKVSLKDISKMVKYLAGAKDITLGK